MRTYPTEIGELPSVTWVLRSTPHFWMPNYIKKKAREALWDMVNNRLVNRQQQPTPVFKGDDTPIITPEIEISDIQYCLDAHKRHSETAMAMGSLVHSCIEVHEKIWDYGEGQEWYSTYVDFLDEYYPSVSDMVQTYWHALSENGIKVLESEQTVWHPMGYAGTLDLISEMVSKLWIGDIKTFESKEYKSGKPKKPLSKRNTMLRLRLIEGLRIT